MIDIDFIICYSTVKIERVSDLEQQKLHIMILYIECMSVVWEHVVLDHGADTALNKEFLGIFLFLFVYNNVMSSCSWKAY